MPETEINRRAAAPNIEIDRRHWDRGNWIGSLYSTVPGRPECWMCCSLGAVLLWLAVPPEAINGIGSLEQARRRMGPEIYESFPDWAKQMVEAEDFDRDNNWPVVLMNINDSTETNDEQREARIIKIFGEHGITVRFVN
jgi:hypothetical protein